MNCETFQQVMAAVLTGVLVVLVSVLILVLRDLRKGMKS